MYYSAVDQAGNSITRSERFRVDTGVPETVITSRWGGMRSGRPLFTVSGTDAITPTPALRFSYRIDGGVWSPWSSHFVVSPGLLAAGSHTLEVRAKDLAGNVDATPAVTTWTVSEPRSTGMVTGVKAGTPRGNFTGWVGLRFTTGPTPLALTQLGRWMLPGNTGRHRLMVVEAARGTAVASATVDLAGRAPGGFQYAPVDRAVVLAAKTAYYLVSEERSGGDAWLDWNTAVTTTADVTGTQPVWSSGNGAWNLIANSGRSYVPVDLRYDLVDPPGTGLVTGVTAGTLRSNFTGWVGMRFTTGDFPVVVSELGRWMVAGNSGRHSVALVDASTGQSIASATVDMAGGTAGQFRYASLPQPVTLAARTSYYLVSQETAGGDGWLDCNTAVTTRTAAATVDRAIWSRGAGDWNPGRFPGRTYGPVDCRLSPADPGFTGLVTHVSPGTARSDFTGWVGVKLTTGDAPLAVSHLGRWTVGGNRGQHTLMLVDAGSGNVLTSATVDMAGGTPGQFQYAPVEQPVILAARTSYYLVSQESAGGDAWLDGDTALATTADVTAIDPVSSTGTGIWTSEARPGRAYVPLDLRYGVP